jgi:hypothetical protein
MRDSWVTWKKGPWNTWPLVRLATMLPRVAPVCVQVNVAPTFDPTACPVPTPEVVHALIVRAALAAIAALSVTLVILKLLSS